jgi:hypothetical protein
MKELTNKVVSLALGLVVLFGLPAGAAGARQKAKSQRATAQSKKPPEVNVRSRVNTDFVKLLADPKLNPEFARKYPDPAQRLKAAQTAADADCFSFIASYTNGFDAQGCYIDVTITHNYTFDANATNPAALPHGIYIQMCSGMQISSYQVLPSTGASWLNASIFGSTPSTAPWSAVWWVQPVNGFNNIIPTGQPLIVRLRVPGSCAGTSCVVTVQELTGYPNPSGPPPNYWMCERSLTILNTPIAYSIAGLSSLCLSSPTNNAATLSITNPSPPSGAQVSWYWSPATPGSACPTLNCSMLPLALPWTLAQTGTSNFYNTNILSQPRCYVAVIKDGCTTTLTDVKRIDVCPGPPSAGITPSPSPGVPVPTVINGVNHACTSWQGTLCVPSTYPCPTTIAWSVNGNSIPIKTGFKPFCISTGLLQTGSACSTSFVFQASLSNACGSTTPGWQIVIDHLPDAGTITANPPPPLCYDRATTLTHSTGCGKVFQWLKREEGTPCLGNYGPWTPIGGSQGTSVWWTNDLQKTTQYEVEVENGACPHAFSPAFTVTVKPQLTVTISANKNILCPGPAVLTAHHSWGSPCSYSVTYQWYKDGVAVTPKGNYPTYNATTGGNYQVVVDGGACGTAKSDPITICDPPTLVIKGDCCVCQGETITLTADLVWPQQRCADLCSSAIYNWTTPAGPASGQSIQASQAGNYSLTVNCGGCVLHATYTVGHCPQ